MRPILFVNKKSLKRVVENPLDVKHFEATFAARTSSWDAHIQPCPLWAAMLGDPKIGTPLEGRGRCGRRGYFFKVKKQQNKTRSFFVCKGRYIDGHIIYIIIYIYSDLPQVSRQMVVIGREFSEKCPSGLGLM